MHLRKRVLVTGGAGFLGSHLCQRLVERGDDVLCADNFFTGTKDNIIDLLEKPNFELMRHDVTCPLYVEVDEIYNLACPASPVHYQHDPVQTTKTSVHGAINMLGLAKRTGAKIFQASTSEVYGTAIYTPIDEAHPLQGQSPYSASKAAGDLMAESFHKSFELPIVILRPFNTYGPRQSERAVIPTIIRQVIDPACDVIRVGDLSPKRDFNFVEDTVAAFIAAAILPDTANGEVFNAGSGHMVTIEETLAQIIELTGSTKNVVREEKRVRPEKSEVLTLMANTEKLKAISPWRPETDLSQGLQKTIDWWSERTNNLRPSSEYMR